MKKSKKSFILIGMATVAIGMTAMLQVTKPFNKNVALQETKTYNHRPENILDNVFTEGNTKYLPFIFDKPTDTITKEKITSEFAKAGLTVNEIRTDEELVGTGTQITVKENNTVYNVIVYGDVDGDGYADTMDAYDIILYTKHPTENPITGIYFKAGNVCNFEDDEVDTIDAYQIILFQKGGLNELVEVEPAPDTTKPVITLVGSSSITINVGTTYTDPGAKATNNYGADITSRITTEIKNASGQVVSSINTSSSGKYTITYNVADNNGNTAIPVTRNVEVKANSSGGGGGGGSSSKPETINSIEMKDLPKLEYNYGEELNLTGATITVDSSKGTRTENITSSMVADKDLSQEGTKTITVTYKGKTTTFDVTVLKKIAGLEFTADTNISVVNGNYEVEADPQGSKEVVLGSIKETNQEGGSKLTEEQLNGNIQVELVSSDSEATASDLTVTTKVEDGKILLVAKAKKAGNYTVNASIKYGSDVIALTPAINVRAVKSNKLGSVELEAIEAEEIRIKKPAVKKLIIKNINDETVSNIVAKNITFKDIPSGIEVKKLDENKEPIQNPETNETTPVAYLEISTTLETKSNISFSILASGETNAGNNTVDTKVDFTIGDALVLSDIKIKRDKSEIEKLPLYLENKADSNIIENDGEYYTIFTIEGLDQLGNQLEEKILASDIKDVTYNPAIDGLADLEDGQIGIILPRANRKFDDDDELDEGPGLHVQCFDENGNPVEGNSEVSKIGIAMILNQTSYEIVPSSLDNKEIEFVLTTKEQHNKLKIEMNYKKVNSLNMNAIGRENVIIDEEGNYVVGINEDFVIGTIYAGKYEGPLNQIDKTIEGTVANGIEVSFEETDNGIMIKGHTLKVGTYEVSPFIGNVNLRQNITIKVVTLPKIESINLDNTNVEIGRKTTTELKAISDLNKNGETIKVKDLKLNYDTTALEVEKLDLDGSPLTESASLEDEIKYLRISAKASVDNTYDLEIILYDGQTNVHSETKKISVYQPIARAIEIAPTVNLYETQNENTATYDGRIYTLVDIKAYADTKKTKPITLTAEMIQKNIGFGEEPVNSIYMTIAKSNIDDDGDPGQEEIIDVQYFDKNSSRTSTGEIKSIGFAIKTFDEYITYEKSELNGIDITFKCTNNAQISTVTTQYTNTARLPQEGE